MKKGSKMTLEQRKRVSEGQKGHHPIPWNKGLTKKTDARCEHVGAINSIHRKGKPNPHNKNPERCRKISESRIGMKFTEEHKKHLSDAAFRKFQNGYRQKNDTGKTPINLRIRHQKRYLNWRNAVFERDDFICQSCSERGNAIRAHHIKSFSKYPELRFDVNNGITYCNFCHTFIHRNKLDSINLCDEHELILEVTK